MTQPYDCIIIGSGAAGAQAAHNLAAGGQRVLVLEARDRVGGRTLTTTANCGLAIDQGGQWLGPGQDRALALVDKLNIRLWPQPGEGRHLLRLQGRTHEFRGNIPALPLLSLLDLQLAIWRLRAMSCRINPVDPGLTAGARRWDQLTVADWMRRGLFTQPTRASMRAAVHAVFAEEPEKLSMLQFLYYLRSAGGLMPLISTSGGAQEQRLHGGAQQLTEGLQRLAEEQGAEWRLGAPVRAVEQDADGVTVRGDGESWRAARCVVAMAPAAARHMDFPQGLPAARQRLLEHMPMGAVIKLVAVYPQPFWRDQGYSGEMVGDEAPLRMCFDATPPGSEHGALVGFILGDEARHWSGRSARDRREAVCRQLAGLFGAAAGQPVEFIEKDWVADEWSHGCYVGLMQPGIMSDIGAAVREPTGRVHWAGTETATRWNGYIEGALQSGERVADEILGTLL